MSKPSKAIILGAGPVGLVTGWKLAENGWEVDIYEKEEIVGGMCRTWKWGDFLVDTGPHIYHTPDAALAQFWEKEFGDLFVKGEFWCKNVRGDNFDEYWDYPLSWESISRYPQELKERILKELGEDKEEAKAKARNFTEYVEAQVGPTLREMFFKIYPEKIWGISTDEMTPDWAPKRIEFRQKVTPFYHNQWNAVGKYGTGCIYERIRDKFLGLGGRLHLGAEVRNISVVEKNLKQIEFADGHILPVAVDDVVISSLPITLTARFFGHKSKLSFRGICSVYLAYRRSEILPKGIHWLYYGAEEMYFNRITEPKKLSPYVAPDDSTYLTVEITYSKGDEIDTMAPEELMRRVAEQVSQVGLASQEDIIDSSLNKENFVYPLQYTGYQEELARARAALSQYQQFYSIGTGGDFNYADSQILFHKAFDTVSMLCSQDSSYAQVVRQTNRCDLNQQVQLAGRLIGKGERAYIIAEAGLNHNGSLELAKQLVDEAVKIGCDAIKFQTFEPEKRISRKVKSVKYAETVTGIEETLFDMFARLSMPHAQQVELFSYARAQGIEVFSTPFDRESVDFLESLNVKAYKIASMDLVNLPLIRYVAKTNKPIILSTGMSSLGQIEEAVEVVRQEGNPNLILLQCNSSYPAAPEEMNLNVIRTLKSSFNLPVGLSDHTFGLFVAHTAIAIGADVIERHFTINRTFEGPDHILSSEPEEMAALVTMAKKIPAVLGDGSKRVQPNEYDMLNMQRKSLYAACNINKGDVVTADMVAIKGPGGGILPRYIDLIIGRVARDSIEEDFPITWDVI
jgi:sialic acid synthase SpsE/protoporphyrinogen oxidase